jgi:hypothetical protein
MLIALGTLAVLAAGVAGTVRAAGDLASITPKYSSGHVRFTVRFRVFDGAGACGTNPDGSYTDANCSAYDTGSAALDYYVYRRRPRPLKLIRRDTIDGHNGKAVLDLSLDDLNVPRCGRGHRHWSIRFRITFVLFDPVSDDRLDSRSSLFRYNCQ